MSLLVAANCANTLKKIDVWDKDASCYTARLSFDQQTGLIQGIPILSWFSIAVIVNFFVAL